jgi:beta-lactamase regulating signal transducer with metallopeptidase domain
MKTETRILILWLVVALAAALLVFYERVESRSVESFPDHSEIKQ